MVSFPLPSDSLPLIRTATGQGDVKVTAQDSGGKALAVGKLAVIDNQINQATAANTHVPVISPARRTRKG
jgi:hypothetical protein